MTWINDVSDFIDQVCSEVCMALDLWQKRAWKDPLIRCCFC